MMEDGKELVLFYNVENLFSPDHKIPIGDEDKNSGLRKWGEWRYRKKLEKIAHVFNLIHLEKGLLPMLIGLAEIESQSALEDLVQMPPFNGDYGFVHYDSLDERGVDTALLYDNRKIELIDSETMSFIFEYEEPNTSKDTTRDVLHCKVKYGEEIIHVFVVHLPSKKEQDINQPKRDYILKNINERVVEIIQRKESVIVCGDFNENPYADNLNFLLFDGGIDKVLENPFVGLYSAKNYSTFHMKKGLLFDQIILSQDFFSQTSSLVYKLSEVFAHEEMKTREGKFKGKPFRTYAGTRYLGGYSDHFPVLVEFQKQNLKIE